MSELLEMLGTAWPVLALGVVAAAWVTAANRKNKPGPKPKPKR